MATEIQQAQQEIGGLRVESVTPTGEGRADMVVNMGPQHPSTHGVLRVVLDLQGENIVGSQVHIGYLHRGIEKLAESRTLTQIIPLTDRTDYTAAMTGNQGLCVAVERLMELEVPPRGRYIRTMIAELQRIASHLIWLGTHALDIGAATIFLYCFRERERILDFFERFSGARLTYSYYRVGGVMADAPPGILQEIYDFMTEFVDRLAENEELLTANDIWLARTKKIGLISAKEAIAIGLTGPSLRGSGVAYDIRKAEPYDAYADVEFDIPTFPEGDVYARYLVRIEEMKQSVRIIRQCIDKMPDGPVQVEDSRVTPPSREVSMTHMESMINHFMWNIHSFPTPVGEVYSAIESPKGELGYYIVSDGSNKPYRLRIRPPSFCNLQALPLLIKGYMIADVVACIGSIDIVLGEVDR
ncbi:MAG TPA: NADH dehydrogenase (quinone) subunit D [Chloroflexota bacterium]|jgi:NADH dehydrogenase I D subunit|nr:NADH dehydrogenase (quinone) subunit D [Chloroflexota bacterium]